MNYEKYIDHTLLKPDASNDSIIKLCQEAKERHFASVCVNPCFVSLCYNQLKGSDVKVCTVIGFPLGANSSMIKDKEAREAVFEGATEVDMVINISRLKAHDDDYVRNEISRLKKSVGENIILKVIIETCLLTEEEKIRACLLAKEAGADFVKTSTGFSTGGATKEDIALMRKTVGTEMGVKASGGIRTKEAFLEMISSGANRIGTSSGIKIIEELNKE